MAKSWAAWLVQVTGSAACQSKNFLLPGYYKFKNYSVMKAKKLIEVALPIKEISAESVRDKSIRHGHISTLHLWWARRPLPVCRAIVFASLVPDPLDKNCPLAFKDAVTSLLSPQTSGLLQVDPYKPYTDIPYTSIEDPMEDNLRNRLMMFIGKLSDKCQQNMMEGKSTSPKEQLADGSLIKWENKNNPTVLKIARELIWVAYNSDEDQTIGFESLHKSFEESYSAIKVAEKALYGIVDRHIYSDEVVYLEKELNEAIEKFLSQMPSVFDPFAGGGAIPLEAARLGCRSYGNDINPVAHIIEKGSAEFPQKYGKPIIYSEAEFTAKYGKRGVCMAQEKGRNIVKDANTGAYHIPNRLSWDVEFYAKELLEQTEKEVGYLYPADESGNKPIAYYWARTAKCSNPSCGAEVPLLKQFYLANTSRKKVYLNPIINGTDIQFEIKEGKYDEKMMPGWNNKGNLVCPCCGCITTSKAVKKQACEHGLKQRFIALITEAKEGKQYVIPTFSLYQLSLDLSKSPTENMTKQTDLISSRGWGIDKWYQMFSNRQLHMLQTFVSKFSDLKQLLGSSDYNNALFTYLALWIDRIAIANTALGRWDISRENIQHPFSRQAIAMVYDYPESNPFCSSSGSATNQLDWILRYLDSESDGDFSATFANASSGEKNQFDENELTAAVTDPPYYDAIAYADISDFFYVWMKRTLSDIYPLNFSTPQTPKAEECTALKHHHNNSEVEAKQHFEHKLTEIFDAIEYQTSDIVSIMFAHQSTEAWTTLCNSILGARMNILSSWPMDTEMANRSLGLAGAALESSVTVACRPSERKGYGDYKAVKKDIENTVTNEVESLYELGFRGADLLTACFGQAVSEFGRYKTVEKSDGSEVSVAELLEMARNAAFDALLKGVQGDDYTKFYIGWLQLNGTGEVDFDDATKFTRVGVNININDIKQEGLLILEGKKMHIAMAEEHIGKSSVEGTRPQDSPIKQAHRFILLYRESDRAKILSFVRDICPDSSSPLWRLLATLKELLPANDDQKQIVGILQNADDFRQNCHDGYKPVQGNLFEDL